MPSLRVQWTTSEHAVIRSNIGRVCNVVENEFKFRRLLEVEQVATDFTFLQEYFEETMPDDAIFALLDLAYRREIHNRDYNQSLSQFDKRLKLDREIWYSNIEREGDNNGA